MPVPTWSEKPLYRDLAVVGHGRGATSYAAAWLQANGVDVRHERIGPQGIVESGFSVPTWGVRAGLNQGLTRDKFEFNHKLCILRNPWKVIATYEAVEHPCAIMGHWGHIPGLFDGLTPGNWGAWSDQEKWDYAVADRGFRVNVIARSVVRWTRAGIEWAGDHLQAEGQWGHRMPDWLEARGLWVPQDRLPVEPPKGVNHRPGNRLSKQEINSMLDRRVYDELSQYALELGYD